MQKMAQGNVNSGNKILYVNKVALGGWLDVRLRSGVLISICEYTKVKILESRHGVTWFVIQDGWQKGVTASLSDANAKVYLGSKAPQQTGVNVMVKYLKEEELNSKPRGQMLLQQTATLNVNGTQARITLNSIPVGAKREHDPLPPGLYRLRAPDGPHPKGATEFYRRLAEPGLRNDQVWFPIEYGDNSRYIHLGHLSHGCVTIMQLEKWNAIYQALIEHRISGTEYVGQILISK
jgi:hypothetical protein